MIISMTGFGKSETKFQRKKLNAEIRSLNSKNIDLNLRVSPTDIERLNLKLEQKLTENYQGEKLIY